MNLRFGEFMGFTGKKLKVLSLGSEQEEKARDVIRECSSTATWVVLLNCHLVPHWMDELEYLCEDLAQDSTNQDFRYMKDILFFNKRLHIIFRFTNQIN